MINYLANLLTLFIKTDRLYRPRPESERSYKYLTDLILEADQASPREQFLLYSHVANYSLYLSGIFPE